MNPDHPGSEALRAAVTAGQTPRVLELLRSGVPIVVDADGQTALHLAASVGNFALVDALIQAGCDVGIQDFVSLFLMYSIIVVLKWLGE